MKELSIPNTPETSSAAGLLEQANLWQSQAESFMTDSGFLRTLRAYGKVQFSGSYRLGLMTEMSDIDAYVINPEVTEQNARKALNGLLDSGPWEKHAFFNFVDVPKPGFPPGYYIWVTAPYGGRHWDLDVRFVKEYPPEQLAHYDWLTLRLDDEMRRAILSIKQTRDHRGMEEVDSIYICDAVVRNGIRTFEEFERALAKDQNPEASL